MAAISKKILTKHFALVASQLVNAYIYKITTDPD